jgi:hypothetical protein
MQYLFIPSFIRIIEFCWNHRPLLVDFAEILILHIVLVPAFSWFSNVYKFAGQQSNSGYTPNIHIHCVFDPYFRVSITV